MGKLGLLKEQLLAERGHECECCGWRAVWHAAHVFAGTDKRFRSWTDRPENITLACLICHGFDCATCEDYKRVDTHEFRKQFFEVQAERYDLLAWWEACPEGKKKGLTELAVMMERLREQQLERS